MEYAEGSTLYLFLLFLGWAVGGWLLVRRTFVLHRHERVLVGFAFGVITATWLTNLLAQVIPASYAFWLGPLFLLVTGMALSLPLHMGTLLRELKAALPYLICLGILMYIFTKVGQGLAIFDEFQTIPLVSLLAAGNVPPNFVLNPEIHFGYHYFLLLSAAQIMRLGNVFPWTALDLARSIILASTLLLGYLWAYRITKRMLVGWLTAIFLAFATGVRWLLLLLPGSLVRSISESVQLIGSGAVSANSLQQAITSPWAIEGDGPFPFPFVFADGISHPFTMTYNGIGMTAVLILLLLLLTADRRRNFAGSILLVTAISALALANEVTFGLIYLGFLAVVVVRLFQERSLKLPASMLPWIGILFTAGIIALLQGGMFTEIARSFVGRYSGQATESFYSNEFTVVWIPEVISIHLGRLVLSNPAHLLVAALEMGPILFVLPFVAWMGWRAIKRGNWYQAMFWMSGLVSLGAMFVVYTGSAGISSTTRILEGFINVCKLGFVPLLWVWSQNKKEFFRIGLAALGVAAILGGVIHFGISLTAAAKPAYTFFISDMDVKMLANNWNRFEPGALVFDPDPVRGVTVLGRYSFSSNNWGQTRKEWDQLLAAPDPYALRQAGFSYIYYDIGYWEQLTPQYQEALAHPCAQTVDRADGYRSEKDFSKDYRVLLDIRSCLP